jgi:hypothetical protein
MEISKKSRAILFSFRLQILIGAAFLILPGTSAHAQTNCVAAGSGIVAWWRAEGNALDSVHTNNGTLAGNTAYTTGEVGQSFAMDGTGDAVQLGNPPDLRLQNFTIEAWIKRASTSLVTGSVGNNGLFFGYGAGGYGFGLDFSGHPMLTQVDNDQLSPSAAVTDTNFHHLAVTKSGTVVVFYIDGISNSAGPYNSTFSFSTPAAIGARGDSLFNSFLGRIDELAIYNRALSATEVQSIYGADGSGKCLVRPFIISQPSDLTGALGGSVTLGVDAGGTPPLSYQWRFNGSPITNATNASLILTNLTTNQSGAYSVQVTNPSGSILSSNANLIVNSSPCVPPPSGLLSWWRADGSPVDSIGTNHGVLVDNTSYRTGASGQGFILDGNNDAVTVGSATNLRLQNFTIEAWVKRASNSLVTGSAGNNGLVFGFGGGGYGFGLDASGHPMLSRIDLDQISPDVTITDTNLHHLAVTKNGTAVVFYVDGAPYSVPAYNTTFVFATPAAIGARGDNFFNSFSGALDEVSIYNRALALNEIQSIYNAGSLEKCAPLVPPFIVTQPVGQTTVAGGMAFLSVTAGGTPPLSYQWMFNGSPLANATGSALNFTGTAPNQAGTYFVVISNQFGSVTSSNANLVVNSTACLPIPSGLVSWWRAETNTLDSADSNSGSLVGNTTYAAGEVGRGFLLDGTGDAVQISNPANLQLQNFTIEAWIKRTSASLVTGSALNNGLIFSYGAGGYGFGLDYTGRPMLTRVDSDQISPNVSVSDTNLHHLAVTKSGTTLVFYIDGIGYTVPGYNNVFSFTTPAAIGARGDNTFNSFLGTIDELSIYNRALSASEIQSIYNADGLGKCAPIAPFIFTQPANQTTGIAGSAAFNVVAGGGLPLSYQWLFNGVPLAGKTGLSLTLVNVQPTNAGNYSVLVTNAVGSILSSNAFLTVVTNCNAAPTGLVSWWKAESNVFDEVGGNHGTLAGNTSYAVGEVGQSFVLDGNGDAVSIGNPTNLQLQNFTIEAWIKRGSSNVATLDFRAEGLVFGYGSAGYGLGVDNSGHPLLTAVDVFTIKAPPLITNTAVHHLAVTKSGSNVIFYVDGAPYPGAIFTTAFTFSSPAAIGARGDDLGNSFLGSIDETSVYNRALSAAEIQNIYNAGTFGKCDTAPPFIITQPSSQTVRVGDTAGFSVAAGGALPLSYQWSFNGSPLANATSPSLTLTNVITNQAGIYSVTITNLYGSVPSSNATLIVNPLPPCAPPPSNLVSWWRAEGNALDQIDGNNGTLAGNTTYGPGQVGQGFIFDGNGDGVPIGNPTNLRLQDFTIEAWIKRTSSSSATFDSSQEGLIFGYGSSGYGLGVDSSGQPLLTQVDVFTVKAPAVITDTNWHHLAVTKSGTNVIFFVDGASYPAPAFTPTFTFTTSAAIGARGDNLRNSFFGKVDETSIYSRPLSAAEIQSIYNADGGGKCTNHPPTASNMSAATKQNLSMSIPVEKFLLLASDPDGDPLTLSSVSSASTNGGPVSIGGGSVTYTPPTNFIGADRFTYNISDGRGGTGAAFVLIQVRSADQISGNMFPLTAISGGYLVSFAGIPGRTYTLQRATNVSGPWITLVPVMADPSGIGSYSDTNSPPVSAFYRTIYP